MGLGACQCPQQRILVGGAEVLLHLRLGVSELPVARYYFKRAEWLVISLRAMMVFQKGERPVSRIFLFLNLAAHTLDMAWRMQNAGVGEFTGLSAKSNAQEQAQEAQAGDNAAICRFTSLHSL